MSPWQWAVPTALYVIARGRSTARAQVTALATLPHFIQQRRAKPLTTESAHRLLERSVKTPRLGPAC